MHMVAYQEPGLHALLDIVHGTHLSSVDSSQEVLSQQ